MPAVQWCLGLPHQGTVAARQGGSWRLDVRHGRCGRWTWKVFHTGSPIMRLGSASSAGMAIRCAEGVLEELEQCLSSVESRVG